MLPALQNSPKPWVKPGREYMCASREVVETAGRVVTTYTDPCLEEPPDTRLRSSVASEHHLPFAGRSSCGWRLRE